MSGVGATIDLTGLISLQERIDRLAGLSASELRPLLDDIGGLVESQTRRRIESEKRSPEGEPWPELDPEYEERKSRKSSGGILEFMGTLLDDINYQVSGRSVEVGTALIYGAVHQEGFEGTVRVGGHGRGKWKATGGRSGASTQQGVRSHSREMNIPARPYLGLSPENEGDIVAVIDNFIDGIMGI